jgi:MoxR-like ATPase
MGRHNQSGYRNRLVSIFSEFENKTLEREELIRIVILAIFCKQHIFLFGEPGVGKTYLARRAANIFGNDNYWELLMANDTQVKQLMGSLQTDENGRSYRSLTDTMLDKPFVFLDEMFKARNEVLNSLLEPMLDRQYTQGGFSVKIPLVTLFGASNEFPEGENIKPFEDRLMFRYDVKRIQLRENKLKFSRGDFDNSKTFKTTFDFDEIDFVFEHADKIEFSDEMLEQYVGLQDEIRNDGIKISDRKFGPDQAVKVLRVSAYLNGRKAIDVSDFMLLRHIAWHNLTDRKKLHEVLNNSFFGNPVKIKKRIADVKERYDRASGQIEARCGKLLANTMEFMGNNANMEFINEKRELDRYHAEMSKIYKEAIGIDRSRQIAMRIEEYCSENIFLHGIKQKVYSEEINIQIDEVIGAVTDLVVSIEEWGSKNDKLFDYMNEYHRVMAESRRESA